MITGAELRKTGSGNCCQADCRQFSASGTKKPAANSTIKGVGDKQELFSFVIDIICHRPLLFRKDKLSLRAVAWH
jgi:hypothetical protein